MIIQIAWSFAQSLESYMNDQCDNINDSGYVSFASYQVLQLDYSSGVCPHGCSVSLPFDEIVLPPVFAYHHPHLTKIQCKSTHWILDPMLPAISLVPPSRVTGRYEDTLWHIFLKASCQTRMNHRFQTWTVYWMSWWNAAQSTPSASLGANGRDGKTKCGHRCVSKF